MQHLDAHVANTARSHQPVDRARAASLFAAQRGRLLEDPLAGRGIDAASLVVGVKMRQVAADHHPGCGIAGQRIDYRGNLFRAGAADHYRYQAELAQHHLQKG